MTRKIQTSSGRLVNPFSMRIEDISLHDIAHALEGIGRFGGHTSRLYSVAEHSIGVAYMVRRLGGTKEDAQAGLLHDAAEAYLGDIPSPLKYRSEFAFLREAEARIQGLVWKKYGLEGADRSLVKKADQILLGLEARDLMNAGHNPEHWPALQIIPQHVIDDEMWNLGKAGDWYTRGEFLRAWEWFSTPGKAESHDKV